MNHFHSPISTIMSQFKHHPLRRALLFHNKNTNTISDPIASTSPNCYLFPQLKKHHPHPINFFSTTTSTTTISDQQSSFTVSYLKDKCGFSQEVALKALKQFRFDSPQKPDSVLSFFRNHGFSQSQINSILVRRPNLLTCDTNRRLLPKFQFLASKGASHDDIVLMVTRCSSFLRNSLENHIVPMYEFVKRFFPSDDKAIALVISFPPVISDARVQQNVNMLLDEGLSDCSIRHLFRTRPSLLCSTNLRTSVQEVKQLGFHPSKVIFSVALLAKKVVTRSQWDAKVEAFKKWGWSEQEILGAFRRNPQFMLRSTDKLNAVMSFWIGKNGWDRSVLLARPTFFGFSLEKRFIPRASVVHYLLSKGLMKETASLATPFDLTDELFLQKFVTCFSENDRSQLVKLYQGGC